MHLINKPHRIETLKRELAERSAHVPTFTIEYECIPPFEDGSRPCLVLSASNENISGNISIPAGPWTVIRTDSAVSLYPLLWLRKLDAKIEIEFVEADCTGIVCNAWLLGRLLGELEALAEGQSVANRAALAEFLQAARGLLEKCNP